MAHKLISVEENKKTPLASFFAGLNGRVGASIYFCGKEIFFGIVFSDTILEQVIRKRSVKTKKAQTMTYGFDPFS